jgi:hypothetical protein
MTREEAQSIIDAALTVNDADNDAEVCVSVSLSIYNEHLVDVLIFDSRDFLGERVAVEHMVSYLPDAGTPAEMVERIMKYHKAVTK